MTDLNSLMIGHNAYVLVYANDVNDDGVIVGGASNAKTGRIGGVCGGAVLRVRDNTIRSEK